MKRTKKATKQDIKIDVKESPVGILTFNLNDPYQRESFKNAVDADELKEFKDSLYDNFFRPTIKYGVSNISDKPATQKEVDIITELWAKISSDAM